MSTFYFFSGGIAELAGVAALFPRSWRVLYVVTSLPSLAFAVAVVPFVSESPRWYLVRRRPDDTLRVIRDIAATNGRAVPEDLTLRLDEEDEDDEEEQGKDGGGGTAKAAGASASSESIFDVFRSRTTRVRLVLSVPINLLISVVYYGLSLNVVNLKTNLYVTVVVNSLAEMPAYLLTALLLDHFGRKPLAIGTKLLSGVFCTAGSLIPRRRDHEGGADGVRRGGHLRHGGDVQPVVHLHCGAVPDGGAERGAGGADGGHRGAAGGDARGEAAVRGVRRLGDRRRPARLLPAGDDEQAPVRHHGRAGGRGEERSRVTRWGERSVSRWQMLGAQINGLRTLL
ncbi:unnamed protein product [Miscanthus lutarioriparius]|uniref:H(+)/Pi cotransporter n=1 Tax=Miscanthus lutarioriparius TaxID=422564 RepID=A0A811QTL7_9POAL|nr:unnamed protein product [Miscanthus lutarioriparius]